MILTNNKITDQAYFCNRMGYDLVCSSMSMEAAGGTQGGA